MREGRRRYRWRARDSSCNDPLASASTSIPHRNSVENLFYQRFHHFQLVSFKEVLPERGCDAVVGVLRCRRCVAVASK
jgi:hypothetical protein